jgi:hypothetical protein
MLLYLLYKGLLHFMIYFSQFKYMYHLKFPFFFTNKPTFCWTFKDPASVTICNTLYTEKATKTDKYSAPHTQNNSYSADDQKQYCCILVLVSLQPASAKWAVVYPHNTNTRPFNVERFQYTNSMKQNPSKESK